MATDNPPKGNPAKWPTADAINGRIETSEASTGNRSPLHGMGNTFLEFGNKYGINPGVVCAILQRESQLGTDGSILPTRCNNFGGNTAGSGDRTCKPASGIAGREWKEFSSPRDGLEGVFQNLNTSLYRSTGGRLGDVMEVYAPSFENDHDAMFMTFAAVGSQLGIVINRDTNIYSGSGTAPYPNSSNGPEGTNKGTTLASWFVTGIQAAFFRIVLFGLGIGLLFMGVRKVIT